MKLRRDVSVICLTAAKKKKKTPRLSSVTSAQKNDNTVEARAAEILKYILKYYFSMENSDNKSNKKAIMEVLCRESHSEQINIYVTSIRFGGGTDAMIFNYKTAIWSISFRCFPEHLFGGLQLDGCKCIHSSQKHLFCLSRTILTFAFSAEKKKKLTKFAFSGGIFNLSDPTYTFTFSIHAQAFTSSSVCVSTM